MTITRSVALAILTSLVLSVAPAIPSAEAATPVPFSDMENSWYRYREAVQYLKAKNVIGGYEDGTFKPKQTINRAELLKIVFKGKSGITPSKRRCFSDVNPDAWYAPYVCTAKQRGIVDGYPDGSFKADEPVNFAEAVKIILNAYGHEVERGTGKQWYKPYVEELDRLDVLSRSSYLPWQPLTRERAADVLWRMLRHDEERFIARMSPGCGRTQPTAPNTVTVNGVTRSFLLTIPAGYVPHDAYPLIFAFHGRTNDNAQVRNYMKLDRQITDAIIVYPAAISNGKGSFSWADPGDKAQEIRDIKFFDAMVEALADDYCINMDRISVVGHSLGAWIANTIACVRGDVVRASATVGGDTVITTCNGPAAAMIIHNPKDNLAPFSGAQKVLDQRLVTNVCDDAKPSLPGPEYLNCKGYAGCTGNNDILFCPSTIDTDFHGDYYPHTWPNDTALYMREFLQQLYRKDDEVRR